MANVKTTLWTEIVLKQADKQSWINAGSSGDEKPTTDSHEQG